MLKKAQAHSSLRLLCFFAAKGLGAALLTAGCASAPEEIAEKDNPPMRPGGPNWEEIDKSVQRIKDREQGKPRLVETERSQEQGFRKMSDDDYTAALDDARAEIKKAHPKMTDAEVEKLAGKRADEAKSAYERTVFNSASSSYEVKKP